MVKIEFEFEHEAGTFRDTIVLPEDHSLTDVQIDAMKVQRFEAWQQSLVEQEETEQTEVQ
jgi:hypothetical protein